MNLYTTEGALLYASSCRSLQDTIETAIEDGIILDNINLKNKDLRNINFDGAIMRKACLVNTDLTGANMSEGIFDYADFSHAQLYNTCIAYSSLNGCSFLHTNFGATDLSQSIVDQSVFAGPSVFSIAFRSIKSMKSVEFLHNGAPYPMHQIPISIQGPEDDINILDQHVIIEHEIFTHQEMDFYPPSHINTKTYKNEHLVFYNSLIQFSKNRVNT